MIGWMVAGLLLIIVLWQWLEFARLRNENVSLLSQIDSLNDLLIREQDARVEEKS